MKTKELINIINIYNAPVVYDDREELEDKIKKETGTVLPIYIALLDDIQRKEFEKCKDKSTFVTTTAAIHLPDLTLSQLVELLECDGASTFDDTKKQLVSFLDMNIPENVVYVSYLFLHEVGHWFQLTYMQMKVESYMNEDIEKYRDNFNMMQEVWLERKQRLNKEDINNPITQCNLTFREKQKLVRLQNEYRNIPKEKSADEFAIKNLGRILDVYKNQIITR